MHLAKLKDEVSKVAEKLESLDGLRSSNIGWLLGDDIKNCLELGYTVPYRTHGWSLHPLMNSQDLCIFKPVKDGQHLHKEDVVFCRCGDPQRYFAHKIKDIEWVSRDNKPKEPLFTIANERGYVNGRCYSECIWGRLVCIMQADPTAQPPPEYLAKVFELREKGKGGEGAGVFSSPEKI